MVIDEFCFVSTTIYGKWLEPTEPLHHAEGWPSLVSRILTTGLSCPRSAKLHYVITCLVHLQAMTQQASLALPGACQSADEEGLESVQVSTQKSRWLGKTGETINLNQQKSKLARKRKNTSQRKASWRQLTRCTREGCMETTRTRPAKSCFPVEQLIRDCLSTECISTQRWSKQSDTDSSQ